MEESCDIKPHSPRKSCTLECLSYESAREYCIQDCDKYVSGCATDCEACAENTSSNVEAALEKAKAVSEQHFFFLFAP
jgi:hypothetical protein